MPPRARACRSPSMPTPRPCRSRAARIALSRRAIVRRPTRRSGWAQRLTPSTACTGLPARGERVDVLSSGSRRSPRARPIPRPMRPEGRTAISPRSPTRPRRRHGGYEVWPPPPSTISSRACCRVRPAAVVCACLISSVEVRRWSSSGLRPGPSWCTTWRPVPAAAWLAGPRKPPGLDARPPAGHAGGIHGGGRRRLAAGRLRTRQRSRLTRVEPRGGAAPILVRPRRGSGRQRPRPGRDRGAARRHGARDGRRRPRWLRAPLAVRRGRSPLAPPRARCSTSSMSNAPASCCAVMTTR